MEACRVIGQLDLRATLMHSALCLSIDFFAATGLLCFGVPGLYSGIQMCVCVCVRARVYTHIKLLHFKCVRLHRFVLCKVYLVTNSNRNLCIQYLNGIHMFYILTYRYVYICRICLSTCRNGWGLFPF